MSIKRLYEESDLTLQAIADTLGISVFHVYRYVGENYTLEERKERKRGCYRRSKLGALNPMTGKTMEQHHNFVGDVSDGKGYLMRLKPQWYTGRRGCKHVFVHQLVVCERLGLTQMPKGWCVHHVDEDKTNNSFDNLVLMTTSDHRRLHRHLEGATTISKESTLKWVEAHGTPWSRDIV